MAKSYRTQKPSVIADKNIVRVKHGVKDLRIIERNPYPGDAHPVRKKDLQILLNLVPNEYLYGLRQIELRARNEDVGNPFAWYRYLEKKIILYSLPKQWPCLLLGRRIIHEITSCGGRILKSGQGYKVIWPGSDAQSLWFFFHVICHELAHHRRFQFHHRDGLECSNIEELLADLHIDRIRNNYLKWRKERYKTETK